MIATLLRHGLVAGLVLCVLMFAPYVLFGPKPEWMEGGQIFGYTAMVLSMSAVFFAVRRERARRGGAIAFAPALGTGIGVTLVASVLFGLGTWAFYALAGDALPEALIAFYQDAARASGDASTVAAKLAEIEAMRPFFFNAPLQGAVMAATVFLIGAVLSVVAALTMRRSAR